MPKKLRDELDVLESKDLPEAGSYFHLLEEEKPADWSEKKFPLDSAQKKPTHPIGGRPPAKGQQKGSPRPSHPKQVHWEEGSRRKERPWLPWHIKHSQRERNSSGQTDAQEQHYNRNAEITKKAAEADKKRKGGYIPWYVKARQDKRAKKQGEPER